MASVYTNHLRLEELGSGEQSGTWGDTTNTNLELIAEAFSYSFTGEAIPDASTHDITMANGASDQARSLYLKLTGGGQACTVTLKPPDLSKVWLIENTTSFTLTMKQGSGATVAIAAGQVKMIATDGQGSGAAVYDLLTDVNLAGTTIAAALTVSGATTQTGVSTSAGKDVFNAGMSVKNGSTSAGFVEFFEDSDNGTNKATLIGPASTADITLTLPSTAGTIATTDDATALAIALG